jgi:hypothetical protein
MPSPPHRPSPISFPHRPAPVMNETDSILESRLRSFEPAALDEALLARLESCADDSLLEPRPEDAELVAALAALRPMDLPDSLRTPLLAQLEKLPFPADEKVLLFPKVGPNTAAPPRPVSQRSDAWFRAAAVALLGAAAALWLTPSSRPDRQVAATPPPAQATAPTTQANGPASRSAPSGLVPTSYDRSLREARNEGIVWQDDRQPHHLIRVVYRDQITLRDANGQTIQVEQPRVEFILVPGKID